MQVLDSAVLSEHILQVLFSGFFVHVGDDDNPALYRANGGCASCGAGVASFGVSGRALGLVNVHFGVCHGCGCAWNWGELRSGIQRLAWS